ncbi:MAG: hypothetical protein UZ22_OP11002001082 [Microgenomates bacterium OLB23]|nr:MAG: hypothetical protein UZ22_OP11002001082 [Microgenomates bacterium OLB23]
MLSLFLLAYQLYPVSFVASDVYAQEIVTPTAEVISEPTPEPDSEPTTEPIVEPTTAPTQAAVVTSTPSAFNPLATLTTDKADYFADETVTLTGKGLNALTEYTLIIYSYNLPAVHSENNIMTDESGGFTFQYTLDVFIDHNITLM